jgi:hypothetical protein
MGYLIQNSGELVKIEVRIREADLQNMGTTPIQVVTQIPAKNFCVVSAFLQIDSTGTSYSGFTHMQLTDGSALVYASFGYNSFNINQVASFICSLKHPVNQFGATFDATRDIFLESTVDPTTGSGDGLLTMYGYYLNLT